MRLNKDTVIKRLKSGQALRWDGCNAYFDDGGHCNINTFLYLKEEEKIKEVSPGRWAWALQ